MGKGRHGQKPTWRNHMDAGQRDMAAWEKLEWLFTTKLGMIKSSPKLGIKPMHKFLHKPFTIPRGSAISPWALSRTSRELAPLPHQGGPWHHWVCLCEWAQPIGKLRGLVGQSMPLMKTAASSSELKVKLMDKFLCQSSTIPGGSAVSLWTPSGTLTKLAPLPYQREVLDMAGSISSCEHELTANLEFC